MSPAWEWSTLGWTQLGTLATVSGPLWRLLTLADYNTRVVILGTALLGCAAGVVGSFTLLRKRALVGDAISHAMLPGLGLAYLLALSLGIEERSWSWLLLGATASSLVGTATILGLRRWLRVSEDAAFGIVLSTFFGAGVALLGVIQSLPSGHAAGLEGLLYGQAASLTWSDMGLIAGAAAAALVVSLLLFKELTLLCFDQQYLSTQGYSLSGLDGILMALVVMIAITGMQAVGLILVIALLIVPAAAARFWTQQIQRQVIISAGLGAAGCFGGSVISALIPGLPAGAVIILVCAGLFLLSAAFGYRQGLLWRMWRRWEWQSALARQHLLRGIYERLESGTTSDFSRSGAEASVTVDELLSLRSWNRRTVERVIERSQRAGLVTRISGRVWLSKTGWLAARRLVHQHRLWELYLITHADVALQQVDRLADDIEHVLEPAVIEELEEILQRREALVAECPHRSPEAV